MAISAGALIGASAIGGLISGGSSFASGAMNSAKAYKQNMAMMAMQYAYQRALNRTAYQDTTYSMRKAGINPMLAITNGASGGSVSGTSVSQAPPSSIDMDLVSAISSAKQLSNDSKRVTNETKTAEQNIAKSKADEALAKAQETSTNLQNDYQSVQNKYADAIGKQNLLNAIKQGEVLDSERALNNTNSAVSMLNARNNTNMINSNIALNSNSAKVAQQNAKTAEEANHTLYRDISRHVRPWIDTRVQNFANTAKYIHQHGWFGKNGAIDSEMKYLLKEYGRKK